MHTCFFFPLIFLSCFPSSATGQRPNDTSLGSAGLAGLVRVCIHAFFSPHLPGLLPSLRRPAPTGAAMATFRPKATFRKLGGGGGGGYVATGPNLSIPNRCDFDRLFRATTCQQPRRLRHVSSRRRRRPSSEHVVPAASGQTTLLSARLAANPARLAGLAGSTGLVSVCTHAFFSPSSAWPASHRLRRPAPTGAAMATFRPKATFRKLGGGGGGGYVATGPNLSIPNRCDFDRLFRATTCKQPRRLLHCSSRRRRRPGSEHVLPATRGQTTLLSARLAANPARLASSAGLVRHLPGLLPIVCGVCGQTRREKCRLSLAAGSTC